MFGGSTPYLRPGEWQLAVIYRRAVSDKHYQGREAFPELDPNGPINTQDQVNLDLSYGLTRRFSLAVNVPLSVNSFAVRRLPPGQTERVWVTTRSSGLGDVSLRGNYWILPGREGSRGNVAFSFGFKAPTGRAGVTDAVFGREIPVDISVQPGDKAWGFVSTLQGFRQFDWFTVFGSTTRYFNPRNTTGVPTFFPSLSNPRNRFPNSSTDQFVHQVGATFRTRSGWPVPLLAYRISGVPVRDVFGASDGFRRPGTIGMIEPGVSYTMRGQTFTVSVPIMTYVNVKDSPTTGRIEDATVPRFGLSLTYLVRFGK